ncbi:transcriptional regulator, HxlR family [Pseudonocardia thermophila]|jgi:Predicted transcriptional regulators|uniref:Transcriptional regulator, HxlR family n=1 Tax=Pseudonocardia thermophila TaxID=1848 RepID=A0A1M6YHR0_PSETH|nr:helix-turn-helix domain-containing protein [Pseudonocardia thermophila]SHL17874.1 transcriptional regulator, HxlR family [Pseudonocardia thermophila]
MSQGHTDVTVQAGPLDHICPLNELLDRISGKWAIGILTLVGDRGPIRFTELERGVRGISRRMLTLTLRNLERDGLLVRTVHPTVPPKVEYSLTPEARELAAILADLTDWALRHRPQVARARAEYDARAQAERER